MDFFFINFFLRTVQPKMKSFHFSVLFLPQMTCLVPEDYEANVAMQVMEAYRIMETACLNQL